MFLQKNTKPHHLGTRAALAGQEYYGVGLEFVRNAANGAGPYTIIELLPGGSAQQSGGKVVRAMIINVLLACVMM